MINNSGLVSIIMTTFNHSNYIAEAIESVLSQTYKNIELIIINDGSSDNTLEIINQFTDSRIKLIDQKNSGPSIAFNNGFQISKGKWIAFMSGDDVCLPTRIGFQVEFSLTRNSPRVIFSHVNFIDQKSAIINSPFAADIFNIYDVSQNTVIRRLFFEGNFLCAPTAFMHREVLENNGVMSPPLFQYQDFDLWCRLVQAVEFEIIAMPLLNYRYHKSNLSRIQNGKKNAITNEYSLVIQRFFNHFTDDLFISVFFDKLVNKKYTGPFWRKIEEAFLFLSTTNRSMQLCGLHNLNEVLNDQSGIEVAKVEYNFTPKKFWNLIGVIPIFYDNDLTKISEHIVSKLLVLRSTGIYFRNKLRALKQKTLSIARYFYKLVKQFIDEASGINLNFILQISFGNFFKKTKPDSALKMYNRAYQIKSNSSLLNYKILLTHNILNQTNELINFYIQSLLINKNIWKKDPNFLTNKILETIKLQKGEFFANKIIQQFGLPTTIDLKIEFCSTYNFIANVQYIEDFCNQNDSEYYKLASATKYNVLLPQIFGENTNSNAFELDVPESWVAELHNVELVGGYCVLKDKTLIVYEPAAMPVYGHQVAGCRSYLYPIEGRPDAARYVFSPKRKTTQAQGILLSGRCSTNYYHWLIEYLPKFLEIESLPHLKNVPLIIDGNMPIQHFQSLEIFMQDSQRKIIINDAVSALSFDKLFIPSVASYIPDNFDQPLWKSGAISERHLIYVRDKIIAAIEKDKSMTALYPEKIYLSRNKIRGRSMINEDKITAIFFKKGFKKIILENLTFQEQVLHIRNAKFIAGPSGAGFSNLLFCKPGTQIISLTSQRNKEFCNFSNLARLNSAHFIYITGPNIHLRSDYESEEYYAHSPFSIPADKVIDILKSLNLERSK